MTAGLDQLGRELAAAERRLRLGQSAGSRPRRSASVLVPALGIIVALAVTAAALLVIGTSHRHSRADTATTVPAGPPRPIQAPATQTTLSELRRILAVLRRPQSPADRRDPSFNGPHSAIRPIVADERLALVTATGIRVYLTPTRITTSSTPESKQSRDAVTFWVTARFPGGSSGAQVTANRIENAQAAIDASAAGPDAAGPYRLALIVPDGVARVTASISSGNARPVHATAHVAGNVAIITLATSTGIGRPTIRWYDAAGSKLPIPYPQR